MSKNIPFLTQPFQESSFRQKAPNRGGCSVSNWGKKNLDFSPGWLFVWTWASYLVYLCHSCLIVIWGSWTKFWLANRFRLLCLFWFMAATQSRALTPLCGPGPCISEPTHWPCLSHQVRIRYFNDLYPSLLHTVPTSCKWDFTFPQSKHFRLPLRCLEWGEKVPWSISNVFCGYKMGNLPPMTCGSAILGLMDLWALPNLKTLQFLSSLIQGCLLLPSLSLLITAAALCYSLQNHLLFIFLSSPYLFSNCDG